MSEETRPTQTEGEPSNRARPILKVVAKNVALNMIPGYPLIGAVRSIKNSAAPGAAVISDLTKRLPHKRKGKRSRTWNQAMDARRESRNQAIEAGKAGLNVALPLPLRVIWRRNVQAKWIFMALAFFALCRGLGYATGEHWIGVLSSLLLAMVCSLMIFKHEYRLRQMETGPVEPDKPLMSAGEFIRGRGFVKHFLNTRIEWK